jgi:hypothetical protein
MTFAILDFLACDLIRREDSGKNLLVGVYGNGILLRPETEFPHKVALAYWVRLTHDVRGASPFTMEIIGPTGGVAYEVSGEFSEDEREPEGSPAIFPFPHTLVTELAGPGRYTARLTFAGATKDIGWFDVRLKPMKGA